MNVNTGSHFLKGMIKISHFQPWAWIAAVFGSQTVGAVLVALLFRLSAAEVALPIFLLFFGMLFASVALRLDSSRNPNWLRWGPAILYAVFIFSLSRESFADAQTTFDTNLFHPVEYATLGILFCWAWYPLLSKRGLLLFAAVVLVTGMLYGVSDEVHQSFVPGRCMSFSDLVLDGLGLFVGCGAFLIGGRVQERLRMLGI